MTTDDEEEESREISTDAIDLFPNHGGHDDEDEEGDDEDDERDIPGLADVFDDISVDSDDDDECLLEAKGGGTRYGHEEKEQERTFEKTLRKTGVPMSSARYRNPGRTDSIEISRDKGKTMGEISRKMRERFGNKANDDMAIWDEQQRLRKVHSLAESQGQARDDLELDHKSDNSLMGVRDGGTRHLQDKRQFMATVDRRSVICPTENVRNRINHENSLSKIEMDDFFRTIGRERKRNDGNEEQQEQMDVVNDEEVDRVRRTMDVYDDATSTPSFMTENTIGEGKEKGRVERVATWNVNHGYDYRRVLDLMINGNI